MENHQAFNCPLPPPLPRAAARLPNEQTERMLLERIAAGNGNQTDDWWQLASCYSQTGQLRKTLECLRIIAIDALERERVAACLLNLGQSLEEMNDFPTAMECYWEALELHPHHEHTWYFINSNLGFCLSTLGKAREGESYCRAAIQVDPRRSNAHKNLGISLERQGRFREAADAFIAASRADASDPRASRLLNALLLQHPELLPELAPQAMYCERTAKDAGYDRGRHRTSTLLL